MPPPPIIGGMVIPPPPIMGGIVVPPPPIGGMVMPAPPIMGGMVVPPPPRVMPPGIPGIPGIPPIMLDPPDIPARATFSGNVPLANGRIGMGVCVMSVRLASQRTKVPVS